MTQRNNEPFAQIADRFAGYEVYDRGHERIGKVEHLFVDESDRLEYIGVRIGFTDTRSVLVPMDIVRIDEERRLIEVDSGREVVENGPTFESDDELTPDLERRIHTHFGPNRKATFTGGGGHEGDRVATPNNIGEGRLARGQRGQVDAGMSMGDTETGEFREHDLNVEGANQPGDDLADRDELRVQRSEEELRAGTREREAGSMRVRKRVRTDRERMLVPKRREEVSVERVPVGGVAAEGEIGNQEIRVPIVEEEIVVEKRPVVKEELRIRKDVVQEEEVVEEDVRKEVVEVYDETSRLGGTGGEGAGRRNG